MKEWMKEWKGIIPNILIWGLFTLLFFFVMTFWVHKYSTKLQ